MKQFTILLLLATGVVVAQAVVMGNTGRLVGGRRVNLNRYSYFSSMSAEVYGGFFMCGAALIHDDILLTAAHCSVDAISYDATINATTHVTFTSPTLEMTEYRAGVNYARPHPEFNESDYKSPDIMVVRLDRVFETDDGFTKVRLNELDTFPNDGATTTVMGLGETDVLVARNPEFLQEVNVNIIPHTDCNDTNSYNGLIAHERMICAGSNSGGRDACIGDGGGPLISKGSNASDDILVGIVSFGYGCGQRDYPGVYTRVSHYTDWIKAQICELSVRKPPYCGSSGSTRFLSN